MSCTSYNCWVNDGKPWKNCRPLNDLIATLYEHGYTGPQSGIGDQSHLTATPPEDHCPYSHSPWPGAQPYPYVMAVDIMPNEGLDIIDLGGRLFDDKSSNKPGTEPIKYINWTDSDGNCWHDSWMPNHTRYKSTDTGHIHISFRTDYVTSNRMATYDPYGDDMKEDERTWLYNTSQITYEALILGNDTMGAGLYLGGELVPSLPVQLVRMVKDLQAKVAAIELVLTPEQLQQVTEAAKQGAESGINGSVITKP